MVRIFSVILLLAFVIVAVFMYTANTAHPEALKLFAPKEEPGNDTVHYKDPSKVFTVILTESNKIYFYQGEFSKKTVIEKTGFKEIREILKNKRQAVGEGFIVIIKGDGFANYQNTVDILDEMAINDIKRYALVDLTRQEADHFGLTIKPGELP